MTKNNFQKGSDDEFNILTSPPPTSFVDKMRIMWSNFKYSTVLCCFKLKRQTNISILEYKIEKLKKNFGVDYLTLVGDDAPVEDLKECLRVALEDLDMLQEEIEDNLDEIYDKELRVYSKMTPTEYPQNRESGVPTETSPKGHKKKKRRSEQKDRSQK